MEKPNNYINYPSSLHHLPLSVIAKIVSYLDQSTIHHLHQNIPHNTQPYNPFFSFLSTYALLNKFVYSTDRSIYLSFYSQTQFLINERAAVTQTCLQTANTYSYLFTRLQDLFAALAKQLSPLECADEIVDLLTISITDPELPFPKMRKQGIGMHANSSFQFFLLDLAFPPAEQPFKEELMVTMEEFFFCMQEEERKVVDEKGKQKQFTNIVETIKYFPEAITHKNYKNYIVKNFGSHNTIVILLALLDALLEVYQLYISTLGTHFDKFIQFVMRYCIFRNIVLDLQNKISPLFKQYTSIIKQVQPSKSNFQLTLWKSAFRKWYQCMHHYHPNNNQIYLLMLHQLRTNHTSQSIPNLFSQHPNIMIQFQNKIEVHQFCLEEQKLIHGREYSPIEVYFEKNSDLYEQVIREYTEYIVDISINPTTVHWCGHTEHQLCFPFQELNSVLVTYNYKYFRYLAKILRNKKIGTKQNVEYLSIIFKEEIQFLEGSLIKPPTLKQMLRDANKLLKKLWDQKQLIELNFQQKNKILEYYNSELQMEFNMEEEIRKQYDILPTDNAQELINEFLKLSSETNDTEPPKSN